MFLMAYKFDANGYYSIITILAIIACSVMCFISPVAKSLITIMMAIDLKCTNIAFRTTFLFNINNESSLLLESPRKINTVNFYSQSLLRINPRRAKH